jgi:SprT protein
MAYTKEALEGLKQFIPPQSFEVIYPYLIKYKIQLYITRDRQSILGNYRYTRATGNNKITVNGGLNAYSFLLTLTHEIAHCICLHQHQNKVAPHGPEWQLIFGQLLQQLIQLTIFPNDITKVLQQKLFTQNASCSDVALERVLLKYNTNANNTVPVEALPLDSFFTNNKGQVYRKLNKRRTRYICTEVSTGNNYLFPATYLVTPYTPSNE